MKREVSRRMHCGGAAENNGDRMRGARRHPQGLQAALRQASATRRLGGGGSRSGESWDQTKVHVSINYAKRLFNSNQIPTKF